MVKRITERLELMIEWLEKGEVQYSKSDFKNEVERMLEAIRESLWCGIITDKQYNELEHLIISKSIKYV